MQGINLKLQGQFKFDLYRPNGELIKSSEYVDNFITNSGVLYPYYFAFADCFRFLTVGDGDAENSVTSVGAFATTGLKAPISQYSYLGGRQAWESGTQYTKYANPGDFGAGCGYINNNNGVSLVRQWNLPDTTGGYFTSARTFKEFMVSPGRPYVTGSDQVRLCSCNEVSELGDATGLDCSSTAEYYNWLVQKYSQINRVTKLKTCDAPLAFARVKYDVEVEPNSILTVTYKLNVILDTGVNFSSLYFDRGDGNPNWNGYLNSFNSITQPGVMLINDGTIFSSLAPNGMERLQHFDYGEGDRMYDFENEYGESFVPPLGAPLEPSSFFLQNSPDNQNIVGYISNDNLQFLVSSSGGALGNHTQYAPWNETGEDIPTGNSGVMTFRNDNDASIQSGSSYWYAQPNSFNTRRAFGTAPDTGDITQSVDMEALYFAAKSTVPSFNYTLSSTGIRTARTIYTFNFDQYRTSQTIQAKSFVVGYKDLAYGQGFSLGDKTNVIPFFDAILSGKSGQDVFIPSLFSGEDIVTGGTGVIITDVDNSNYNTLEGLINSLYPIINTALTWTVPCPEGVSGCI